LDRFDAQKELERIKRAEQVLETELSHGAKGPPQPPTGCASGYESIWLPRVVANIISPDFLRIIRADSIVFVHPYRCCLRGATTPGQAG